jgi:hypothetical protein
MLERIIVDEKGTEKTIYPLETTVFVDKKAAVLDEESILRHLERAREVYREMEVGQRQATVELKPKYPNLPAFIWLNCDDHLGSVLTDYSAFVDDYQVVRETPNFFCLSNGDEVDSFMVTLGSAATGVYENAITPQQQALLMRSLFKRLDDQGKMLAFSFGNHNQWVRGAGYKFENTWLRDFRCPILNCGGLLTVRYGVQEYRIAMTHRYWGASKLNPTNAAKRYMEHEYPMADVLFLGHTHQAESLYFKREGGTDYRYAVIGGTYKVDDEWAAERGIGRRGQLGGFVLELSPDKRNISILKSVEDAKTYFKILQTIKGKTEKR